MNTSRTMVLAHASPGRTRIRLGWLVREPDQAVRIADALVELPGILEVRTRATTGSVLCLHDPDALGPNEIVAAIESLTGATLAAPQDRRTRPAAGDSKPSGSVATALMDGVRDLDRDVRDVTNGRVDLGTLAAAGFLSLGATEVLFTRQLPMPPWFNLAWWAFRTFTAFDHEDQMLGEE